MSERAPITGFNSEEDPLARFGGHEVSPDLAEWAIPQEGPLAEQPEDPFLPESGAYDDAPAILRPHTPDEERRRGLSERVAWIDAQAERVQQARQDYQVAQAEEAALRIRRDWQYAIATTHAARQAAVSSTSERRAGRTGEMDGIDSRLLRILDQDLPTSVDRWQATRQPREDVATEDPLTPYPHLRAMSHGGEHRPRHAA